jgi:hypothetical protein
LGSGGGGSCTCGSGLGAGGGSCTCGGFLAGSCLAGGGRDTSGAGGKNCMATGAEGVGSIAGRKRRAHNTKIWSMTDRIIYERRRDFFIVVGVATASLPVSHEAALLLPSSLPMTRNRQTASGMASTPRLHTRQTGDKRTVIWLPLHAPQCECAPHLVQG